MIQAIFFDLYGTLAGFIRPDRFEIQSEACAGFGMELTREDVLRGYALADAFMLKQSASKPVRMMDDGERERFFGEYERRVLRGCGFDVTLEKAIEIWRAVRQVPYCMSRYDDVLPVMDLLKQQGITLGLISNMNKRAGDLIEGMGLTPYLDFAVTSGEVGMEKPSAPIFEEALRRSGSVASDTIHVGDDLTADVQGAANVGIGPVLIDRDGNHAGFTGCPRIETLVELPWLVMELSSA